MNQLPVIHLTPPLFGDNNIQEKIVCIRAHRERLFNVCVEKKDTKFIFHNYGHGGAGWTFLFGCVNESIRQFEQAVADNAHLNNKPIAIIGAGCYGLLTAVMLARKGHTVRIIAKHRTDIASYKAAGFFFPRARKSSTEQERAVFTARGMESYATYLAISKGLHPFITTGARMLPCYFGLTINPEFEQYTAAGLIAAPDNVIIDFGNGKQYQAVRYMTMFIDAKAMMHELTQAVADHNIPYVEQEVAVFEQLPEQIIFNCAGLGAQKLTNDKRIVPVQGHLITLKNQPTSDALQYMINVQVVMTDAAGNKRDELIYYAPKASGIVGITFKRGQDSLTANSHEFDRLLQRCRDFFGT